MPDLIKLLEQWAVVTAAPIPFAVAVAIAAGLIWLAVGWSYSAVLSSKNAQIELQDRQLADYKQKLDGATPDQARAKIEALERTVKMTVGARWEPLDKSQISTLAAKLKEIPKSRASIMYENALGKEMAESIFAAFKEAGWDQAALSTGSGLGEGIVTGWGTRGTDLKAAKRASRTQ
jgi:hypothetical protein